MAKLAFVLALVLLVCGASAHKQQNGQIQCINDIIGAIPQVQQIITDFSTQNYTGAITDLMNFLPTLQKIVADCSNSTRVTNPVEFLLLGRVRKTEGSIFKCVNDVTGLVQVLPALVADIQSGNLTKIIQDINTVLPLVQNAINDCTLSSLASAVPQIPATGDCLVDISHIFQVVPALFADVQAQNISAIINDVLSLIPLVQNAVQDCSSTQVTPADFLSLLNRTTLEGPTQCLNDILGAIPQVQQVITDISSGNWTGLIVDALNLVPVLQQIVADCSNATTTFIQTGKNNVINFYAEEPECQKVFTQSLEVVHLMSNAIRMKDWAQVKFLVPAVFRSDRTFIKKCMVYRPLVN